MRYLPNQNQFGEKVTGIIVCEQPGQPKQFLKYSYVDNTPRGLQTFCRFAASKPGAKYINFYSRQDGAYIERHFL